MKKVIGNEYFELVRKFPLRQISSDKELDEATAVMDELTSQENRSSDRDSYLDVLSDLVEKYEQQHHPIPDAAPVEVLRFLMDDRRANQRAVAIGSGIQTSTMSEILSGQRQLNLEHMRKLSTFFGVPVSVFLPKDTPAAKPDDPLGNHRPADSRKRAAPKRATAKK